VKRLLEELRTRLGLCKVAERSSVNLRLGLLIIRLFVDALVVVLFGGVSYARFRSPGVEASFVSSMSIRHRLPTSPLYSNRFITRYIHADSSYDSDLSLTFTETYPHVAEITMEIHQVMKEPNRPGLARPIRNQSLRHAD
jgi:hypothetical protein